MECLVLSKLAWWKKLLYRTEYIIDLVRTRDRAKLKARYERSLWSWFRCYQMRNERYVLEVKEHMPMGVQRTELRLIIQAIRGLAKYEYLCKSLKSYGGERNGKERIGMGRMQGGGASRRAVFISGR